MKKQFRIAHLAFAVCLSATAASQSVASCAISSGVMTCTVTTTNDTVDSTGLPANAASLRDAIIQVNSVAPPPSGQTHIINLPANFVGTSFKVTLFKFLPPIWNDVTINGNGNTIEGNNVAITGTGFDTRLFIVGSNGDFTGQPYFVVGARVKFALKDVTLRNGVARGGMGGGGGMGAGGAIFVTGNADVVAHNVRFEANGAVGGAGNLPSNFRAGGGMGGDGGISGGGGWGGNGGSTGGGGLGGPGNPIVNASGAPIRGAGGGGLSRELIGATTQLRGVAMASAGRGYRALSNAFVAGGAQGGGGGGTSTEADSPSIVRQAKPGIETGLGGTSDNTNGGGGGGGLGGTDGAARAAGDGGLGGGGASLLVPFSTLPTSGGHGGFGGGGGLTPLNHPTGSGGGFGGGSGGNGQPGFGGGAASTSLPGSGRNGGFGGGGTGVLEQGGGGGSLFAGGAGGGTIGSINGQAGGHGGGAGLGGAVFVHMSGTFTASGNTRFVANFVQGGAGSPGINNNSSMFQRGQDGENGRGCGAGIFVHGGMGVIVDALTGETVELEDQVADNDCAGTVSPAPFGPGGLVKRGAGALHLRGVMSYALGTEVNEGTLRLMPTASDPFPRVSLLNANARLEIGGSATVGEVVAQNGAVISPGLSLPGQAHAYGQLRVASLTFASSGTRLEINIGGTNPGSEFSRLLVDDAATLNFNPVIFSLNVKPGYTPAVGDSFNIIDYGNATTSGNFIGLPENGTRTVNGVTYQINYGNGGVRLTVVAAPSIAAGVSLSSNLNPATTAQVVGLTATLSAASGGVPTGNVLFRDGTTTIAGCEARPLISGVATCNTTFKPAGARAITAVYLGSVTHIAATSNTLNQTVNKAVASISMGSNSNPALTNSPLIFTATINRNDATGGLSFRADGAPIAGCSQRPLTNNPTNSTATCSSTFAAAGSYVITAVYPGDANYSAGGSAALTQNVIVLSVPGALSALSSMKSAPNGIGQITYSFSAPLSDGGSPITGYTARCTNSITNQVVSVTQLATSLTLSPLTVGQPYACVIFASNAIGDGPAASGTEMVFAPLNIDGSTATIYDAATDGVMILRYMSGIRGDAISDGVIGATATRTATQIATYLATIQTQLDIDGDGAVNATTDGALIVRHMRGMSLSSSYIMNVFNPTGLRGNEDDITSYLARMMP